MTSGVLKYGYSDTATAQAARANFAGAGVAGLSMCTTPIELLSNDGADTTIGTATGFFWLKNGRPHLVTNYHVVSGRNPFTGELTSTKGYMPLKLRFYGVSVQVEGGLVYFQRRGWTLSFDEAFLTLMEKPPEVGGVPVDIWAVPIAPGVVFGKDAGRTGFAGAETSSCYVNEHVGRPIVTHAGDDCFILGYPLDNYEGLMLPIWKRGSIATDTNLGVGGKPIFLVDAAVTPSMSGSPIVRKVTTFTADNRDIGALQEMTAFEFIGVYAGRLQSAQLLATNLGYGWYRTLIDGVVEHYSYRDVASKLEAI